MFKNSQSASSLEKSVESHPAGGRERLNRVLINATIIAYLSIAFVQILPPENETVKMIRGPIEPVVGLFGLLQAWNLFAPKLRDNNIHSLATVTMKDGSLALYELPRANLMEPIEAYRRARFSKMFIDNMFNGIDDKLYRFTAAWVASGKFDANNPPVSVTLTAQVANIPPFENFVLRKDLPQHSERETYHILRMPDGKIP